MMASLVAKRVVPVSTMLRATLEIDAGDLDGQLTTEEALERLVGLGLIEREVVAGLGMHRLVGSYVRQVSGDNDPQAAVERVVTAQAGELTDETVHALDEAFLPILRFITDAALLREDAEAATLCIWLGRHFDRLGSYAPAQPYLARALAINEQVLGAEHPDTASSLNNLAVLYQN